MIMLKLLRSRCFGGLRRNRGVGAVDLGVPGAAGLSLAGGRRGGAGRRGQDRYEQSILKVSARRAEDIVESGDDVADAEMRQRFLVRL